MGKLNNIPLYKQVYWYVSFWRKEKFWYTQRDTILRVCDDILVARVCITKKKEVSFDAQCDNPVSCPCLHPSSINPHAHTHTRTKTLKQIVAIIFVIHRYSITFYFLFQQFVLYKAVSKNPHKSSFCAIFFFNRALVKKDKVQGKTRESRPK